MEPVAAGEREQEGDHGEDLEDPEEEEEAAGATGGAVGGATREDGGEEDEEVEVAVVPAEAATSPSRQSSLRHRRPSISCPSSPSRRTTGREAPTSRGNSTCQLSR